MNHQETMDKAYEVWRATPTLSFADFLRELSARERFAVVLGKLNHQVQNGGWSQWVGNGYARAVGDAQWALRKLNTKASREALEIIDTIVAATAHCVDGPPGDDYACEVTGTLDDELGLDARYYVIDDTLMAEAEAFLSAW